MSADSTVYITVELVDQAPLVPPVAEVYEEYFLGYTAAGREVWRLGTTKRDMPGVRQALRFSPRVYDLNAGTPIVDRSTPSHARPGVVVAGQS